MGGLTQTFFFSGLVYQESFAVSRLIKIQASSEFGHFLNNTVNYANRPLVLVWAEMDDSCTKSTRWFQKYPDSRGRGLRSEKKKTSVPQTIMQLCLY